MLVHLADERPDLRLGERAHAVAEDQLVFGEHGQGLGVLDGVLRHDETSLLMLSLRPRFASATLAVALSLAQRYGETSRPDGGVRATHPRDLPALASIAGSPAHAGSAVSASALCHPDSRRRCSLATPAGRRQTSIGPSAHATRRIGLR